MEVIRRFQTEVKAMLFGDRDGYGRDGYLERIVEDLSKFYERFRATYGMALKSKYYLKLAEIQNQRQKNTISKLETDLLENRKEEMLILDRIMNGGKSKNCCDN